MEIKSSGRSQRVSLFIKIPKAPCGRKSGLLCIYSQVRRAKTLSSLPLIEALEKKTIEPASFVRTHFAHTNTHTPFCLVTLIPCAVFYIRIGALGPALGIDSTGVGDGGNEVGASHNVDALHLHHTRRFHIVLHHPFLFLSQMIESIFYCCKADVITKLM